MFKQHAPPIHLYPLALDPASNVVPTLEKRDLALRELFAYVERAREAGNATAENGNLLWMCAGGRGRVAARSALVETGRLRRTQDARQ